MGSGNQEWVSFQCACGFRLQRLPRDVLDQLPRCLGCGRSLRAPPGAGTRAVKTQGLGDVRDLR